MFHPEQLRLSSTRHHGAHDQVTGDSWRAAGVLRDTECRVRILEERTGACVPSANPSLSSLLRLSSLAHCLPSSSFWVVSTSIKSRACSQLASARPGGAVGWCSARPMYTYSRENRGVRARCPLLLAPSPSPQTNRSTRLESMEMISKTY